MNIRQKWYNVKIELANQMYRLNKLLREEADKDVSIFHGSWTISGQNVKTEEVIKQLGIKFLDAHNYSIIIHKPSKWDNSSHYGMVGYSSPVDYWQSCFLEKHCPLSLKEAETLIMAIQELTPEKMSTALDAALIASSN